MAWCLSCRLPVSSEHENVTPAELRWLAVQSCFNEREAATTRRLPTPVSARLILADPPTAVSRLRNGSACRGCVLLTQRGDCTFSDKLLRGVECGAAAVIVGNTDASHRHSLFAMHGDVPLDASSIPCAMVSHACYEFLCALLSEALSLGAAPLEVNLSTLKLDTVWLSKWERGPAIRAATLMQDLVQLEALLEMEVKISGVGKPAAAYNEADVDRGVTAVHLAVENRALDCLRLLLRCRPMVDTPRNDHFRPIHIAAERNFEEIVALLVEAGCYVDAPHSLGWVAHHFAAQKGAVEATNVLIRSGATLDYRALDGSTPLLVAVLMGQVGVVEALIAAGADPLITNRNGASPYDIARRRGDPKCLTLLGEYQRDLRAAASPSDPSLYHHRNDSCTVLPFWLLPDHNDDPPRVQTLILNRAPAAFSSPPSRSGCRAVVPTLVIGQPECPLLKTLLTTDEDGSSFSCLLEGPSEQRLGLLDFLARAQTSCASTVPSLRLRHAVTILDLPDSMRRELWMAILTSASKDLGGDDGGAADEEVLLLPTPEAPPGGVVSPPWPPLQERRPLARSPPGRVQSLYEDLERTKFTAYTQGEGLERMKRLVLSWLDMQPDNEYKQGLTSLAAPFLEVFGPGGEERALICMSRMIEIHMQGLFKEGATLERLHDRVRCLEALLLYWDPDLAVHLSSLDVIGELYCTPWLMTLFADVLPMHDVCSLWDACLLLGKGFVLCFALAVLLQLRREIMAAEAQASVLVAFSELNAEVKPIHVDSCLYRAFKIWGKTPARLLRTWEEACPARTTPTSSHSPAREMMGDFDTPQVLDSPPVLYVDDLADLIPDIRVLDVREGGSETASSSLAVPEGVAVVKMPFSTVRGHAEYCAGGLSGLQPEIQPPPAVRGLSGRYHITVMADSTLKAAQVARLLAFSHVPFVSVCEETV